MLGNSHHLPNAAFSHPCPGLQYHCRFALDCKVACFARTNSDQTTTKQLCQFCCASLDCSNCQTVPSSTSHSILFEFKMADISALINSPVNEAAASNQANMAHNSDQQQLKQEQFKQEQVQQASVDEDGDQDISNLDGNNDKKGKKAAESSVSVCASDVPPWLICDMFWRREEDRNPPLSSSIKSMEIMPKWVVAQSRNGRQDGTWVLCGWKRSVNTTRHRLAGITATSVLCCGEFLNWNIHPNNANLLNNGMEDSGRGTSRASARNANLKALGPKLQNLDFSPVRKRRKSHRRQFAFARLFRQFFFGLSLHQQTYLSTTPFYHLVPPLLPPLLPPLYTLCTIPPPLHHDIVQTRTTHTHDGSNQEHPAQGEEGL